MCCASTAKVSEPPAPVAHPSVKGRDLSFPHISCYVMKPVRMAVSFLLTPYSSPACLLECIFSAYKTTLKLTRCGPLACLDGRLANQKGGILMSSIMLCDCSMLFQLAVHLYPNRVVKLRYGRGTQAFQIN